MEGSRLIAWLRGDPEALRYLSRLGPLLEGQGVRILLPRPESLIDADIVVSPLPGSPEEAAYRSILEAYNGPVVAARDPLTAMSLALAYPRERFRRLVVGIDPGPVGCGVAALADRYLVEAARVPCEGLGSWVRGISGRVPHWRLEVYLGDGPGSSGASESLSGSGLDYYYVDERGTTRRPPISLGRLVRDKDILAGAAIALRGAYGGRLPNTLR